MRACHLTFLGAAPPNVGGEGGVIALDRKGHLAMPFNGLGSFVRENGESFIEIDEN
jgi:hypothetical protein